MKQLWGSFRTSPGWVQVLFGLMAAFFIFTFMGPVVFVAGLVSLIAGVAGLMSPFPLLRIAGRGVSVVLLLGGLVLTGLGGALLAGSEDATPRSQALPVATTSPTTTIATEMTTSSTSTPRSTTTLPATTSTLPSTTTAPRAAPGLPAGDDTVVERITDGDTIVVAGGERVRLLGIDTPEVNQDACYAAEATGFISSLIPPGTPVRLVYDVELYDRFDRTLAYVYRLDDGLFVNAEMMAQGYAVILTIPPNVEHAEEFLALEQEAREASRGLWSACQVTTTQAPPTTQAGDANCHPSYPDVCIPPPPPDLDCGEIPYRRFTVVPPDPHGFDGDDDGIGCES